MSSAFVALECQLIVIDQTGCHQQQHVLFTYQLFAHRQVNTYRIVVAFHSPICTKNTRSSRPQVNRLSTHHQNQHPRNQRTPQLHFQRSVPSRPMDLYAFTSATSPSFDKADTWKNNLLSAPRISSARFDFSAPSPLGMERKSRPPRSPPWMFVRRSSRGPEMGG